MGYRCKQPGCGYEFPKRPSDRCPNCDGSPFKNDGATYSPEEMKGKKILKNSNSPIKVAQRLVA